MIGASAKCGVIQSIDKSVVKVSCRIYTRSSSSDYAIIEK